MRLIISHLSVQRLPQLLLRMLLLTEPRLLVMVQLERLLLTETERLRSPKQKLKHPKDRKLLKQISVYSFNNKKPWQLRVKTYLVPTLHLTTPTWLRKKLKHYSVLKLLSVRPNRKLREPNMNLKEKDSVQRKLHVKKYLSNKSRLLRKQRLNASAESPRVKQMRFLLATMLKRKVPRQF